MTSDSHKSLAALDQEIEELTKQRDLIRHQEKAGAIDQVRSLLTSHKLSVADIGARYFSTQDAAPRGRVGVKSGSVAAKYADPGSGQTWSGRGVMPRWMKEALASGSTREQFLIAGGSSAGAAEPAAEPRKVKASSKVAPATKSVKPAAKKAAKKG